MRLLMDAAFEEARCLSCTHLALEVDALGALSVFDAGCAVPARARLEALTQWASDGMGVSALRRAAWDALAAVPGAVRVDVWEDARQWCALRVADGWGWKVGELCPAERVPCAVRGGTRLWCLPERGERSVEREVLADQGRALAFLAPGLTVQCSDGASPACTFHYPHGLAQRVDELTASLPRLHAEPFSFDVRWDGLRARCALQWCDVDGGLQLAFLNTCAVPRQSPHVAACLHTVRAALEVLADVPVAALPSFRLMRGLTAVFAVDGPRGRLETLSPAEVREVEAGICERLYPLALEAFGGHPVTPRLVSQALASV